MYSQVGQRSRRRPVAGCIGGLVVVILLLSGLGFIIVRLHGGVALSVGPHPSVIIHNCDVPIVVHAGEPGQVVLPGIFPQYGQDTSTSTIELGDCGSISGINGVMLTVPAETNLQFDTNDSITVLGVSGTMNLSTNGSRITLINVSLAGQSKIDDNGGTITMSGALTQGSNSSLSDNGGQIDLTLPSNAAFHLNANGIQGPIVSDFAGVQASIDTINTFQVDVGQANSGIVLALDMNDTALVLRKGA